MADWTPIKRTGAPTIVQLGQMTAEYSVTLSAAPPAEWRGFFDSPTGIAMVVSLRPPIITSAMISFQATTARLEEEMGRIDQRIAQANRRYEDEVLARLRVIEARNAAEKAKEDARRQQLQAEANRLLPPE